MVWDLFSVKAWKRAGVQVWVFYFVLGLISAGVAIIISSRFPQEYRSMVRVLCFILGMLAIEIRVDAGGDETGDRDNG